MTKTARIMRLGPARQVAGHCFMIELPADAGSGDSVDTPEVSLARLFEDGQELGPGHALHADIETMGGGRFSHWERMLYLSSSNGTPVSTNGRAYDLLVEPQPEPMEAALRVAAARAPALASDYERFELAERLFNLLVPDVKVSEFGRTYFSDRTFAAIYEKFAEGNYRAYDRRWTVGQLARHAVALDGAFAECGVYRGGTAYVMAMALAQHGAPGRKLHLFDSFHGLSRPDPADGAYWKAGDLAASLAEVSAHLAEWSDRLVMHPGWIPSRFADVSAERFAFVHIDVDLYQPTRESLAFFSDRMVPGGIVLCDDYGFASCPGARRAMDEFFAARRETIIHLPTGQGMVVVHGHSAALAGKP
jgi:hypothetical protein